MGVESYKHKFAKTVLTNWLRKAAEEVGPDNSAKISPFSWRVNREKPDFGVWEEYPIALSEDNRVRGFWPVWDEDGCVVDGVYNFGLYDRWHSKETQRPPSYDELIRSRLLPAVIFDIAVQHKGNIFYAIEVVHKNDISEQKMKFLRRLSAEGWWGEVYKVSADWILSQVGRPQSIQATRVPL